MVSLPVHQPLPSSAPASQIVFIKNAIHPWLIFSNDQTESFAENWITLVPLPPVEISTQPLECSAAQTATQPAPFEGEIVACVYQAEVEETTALPPATALTVFTVQPSNWILWSPASNSLEQSGGNLGADFVTCHVPLLLQYQSHGNESAAPPILSDRSQRVQYASQSDEIETGEEAHHLVSGQAEQSPANFAQESPAMLSAAADQSVEFPASSSACVEECEFEPHLSANRGGKEGLLPHRRCNKSGMAAQNRREQALLQVLWPNRWAWEAARDPWPNVYEAEQAQGLTTYYGSLHHQAHVDERAKVDELNGVRLLEDLPVSQMTLNTAPKPGRMPQERASQLNIEQPMLVHLAGTERGWNASDVHWNAPQTTHAPLYFEEINLERRGYSRGYLQPAVSGLKFFLTAPFLPGLMTIDPPNSRQYELGEDRPGSIVAYSTRRPEWTAKAIAVQTSVVLGLSFLIP